MDYLNLKLSGIDKDGNEQEYTLADFAGEKVILYFYPKDNTSGCTQDHATLEII